MQLRDVQPLAAALVAAEQTGLLTALVKEPHSAAELAAECHLDPRTCALLLDLFLAFGLTILDGSRHRATQELIDYARFPAPLADFGLDLWRHASTFLRTGAPLLEMDAAPAAREGIYRDIVASLGQLFSAAADQLVERCGLTPHTILDMGCGSGVWSLAFARRLPATRVTGLDLPSVLDRFRERAAAMGVAERVATIDGDLHQVPLPGSWDMVIVANVLRLEPDDRAQSMIGRAAGALRPGGSLVVVDALAAGSAPAEQSRAVYALHLALRTRSGHVHPADRVRQWMEDAGCEPARAIEFDAREMALGALAAQVARKR